MQALTLLELRAVLAAAADRTEGFLLPELRRLSDSEVRAGTTPTDPRVLRECRRRTRQISNQTRRREQKSDKHKKLCIFPELEPPKTIKNETLF